MAQKYIVYLNGKALFFNNSAPDGAIQVNGKGFPALENAIQILEQSDKVMLKDISWEEGLQLLEQKYLLIEAAGGIVESPDKKLLCIFRMGYWDLPKGKVELGEDIATAAAREILEETGVNPGKACSLICKTWHTYTQKGLNYLKETSWYHFKVNAEPVPVVQTEEQISKACWYSLEEAMGLRQNMFASVYDVLETFGKKNA